MDEIAKAFQRLQRRWRSLVSEKMPFLMTLSSISSSVWHGILEQQGDLEFLSVALQQMVKVLQNLMTENRSWFDKWPKIGLFGSGLVGKPREPRIVKLVV